jgi:hypothetical protein
MADSVAAFPILKSKKTVDLFKATECSTRPRWTRGSTSRWRST